jgi:hypothetical protein
MDNETDLPIMDECEWPVYAVLLKTGELYYHDTSHGNRHATGEGWLMVLPWGEARKGTAFHGDNRFGVEHEDVAAFTLLNDTRRPEPPRREAEQMVIEAAIHWDQTRVDNEDRIENGEAAAAARALDAAEEDLEDALAELAALAPAKGKDR